jgi:hypothetical protein
MFLRVSSNPRRGCCSGDIYRNIESRNQKELVVSHQRSKTQLAKRVRVELVNNSTDVSLLLCTEDGNLLYFELSAFIDNTETIEGIVVSAVDSPHDFLVI